MENETEKLMPLGSDDLFSVARKCGDLVVEGHPDDEDMWVPIEMAERILKERNDAKTRLDEIITDQRDRIGEIFDALECQNKEVEKLRAAIRNLRDVSGRHHSQIACERLFALLPENAYAQPPATGASADTLTNHTST